MKITVQGIRKNDVHQKENPSYYHLNLIFYYQMIMLLFNCQNVVQDQQHPHHLEFVTKQVLGPHLRPPESGTRGGLDNVCFYKLSGKFVL